MAASKTMELQKGIKKISINSAFGRYRSFAFAAAVILLAGFFLAKWTASFNENMPSILGALKKSQKERMQENFGQRKEIEETNKMSQSSSAKWWVNSGARLDISKGTAKTIQGELASGSKWQQAYKNSNPEDTDGGIHPQNIFRLVTRSRWKNFRQQVFFRIRKINLSESENRNESNGFFLFNRYRDGNNLYYTGLRVDGYAVIKKKIGGEYKTLDYEKVYDGPDYDRDGSPNNLPVGKWIGLRSVFQEDREGNVEIKIFWKKSKKAKKWRLITSYIDTGQKGDKIGDAGYGGIRSDFMDVEFDKYKIMEI